ncbi:Flp pilus assembly protein CpaB [Jeongeupia wiesaeckerbachi]|uniref:Flp pilus assembly protein CpaB n=1 Tax=Jeongeupia wiesaeckerbachi TaxID=3051218 RepID=UPI003D80129C
MKSKQVMYIAGALSLALLVFVMLQRGRVPEVKPAKAVARPQVLVATGALEPGAFIEPGHLAWREWQGKPEDAARYFRRGVDREDEVVGRLVRTSLRAGDALTAQALLRAGDAAFLAAVLQPGMRAITVPIDAVSGSAGLIQPGNRVDVILASNRDSRLYGAAPQYQASTLVANARVIAINRRVEGRSASEVASAGEPDEGTATLEVSPKAAQMLSLARGLGELSLSLRSLNDGAEPDNTKVTLAGELMPAAAPTAEIVTGPAAPSGPVMLYGNETR